MMTGYLFYAQFLVIWYGNLPEETRYVIQRIRQNPWVPLPWIILGICFALPFFVLLIRKLKMSPRVADGDEYHCSHWDVAGEILPRGSLDLEEVKRCLLA